MIFSRVHPSYFFTKHFTFLDGVIFAEFFFYSQSITSSPINLTTPFLPHSLLPQLRLSSRWHSLEFPSVPLFKFISFQTIQPFMNDLYIFLWPHNYKYRTDLMIHCMDSSNVHVKVVFN